MGIEIAEVMTSIRLAQQFPALHLLANHPLQHIDDTRIFGSANAFSTQMLHRPPPTTDASCVDFCVRFPESAFRCPTYFLYPIRAACARA
jgi:hypothetical protein